MSQKRGAQSTAKAGGALCFFSARRGGWVPRAETTTRTPMAGADAATAARDARGGPPERSAPPPRASPSLGAFGAGAG